MSVCVRQCGVTQPWYDVIWLLVMTWRHGISEPSFASIPIWTSTAQSGIGKATKRIAKGIALVRSRLFPQSGRKEWNGTGAVEDKIGTHEENAGRQSYLPIPFLWLSKAQSSSHLIMLIWAQMVAFVPWNKSVPDNGFLFCVLCCRTGLMLLLIPSMIRLGWNWSQ